MVDSDTPGLDDSKGKDTGHANNLYEYLNTCGGFNSFVSVQNGLSVYD